MFGYTFKGSKCYFRFCLPSHLGSTLIEKNLPPSEQILSFMNRPHSVKAISSREANRKSHILSPFENMVEKDGGGNHAKGEKAFDNGSSEIISFISL